MFDATVNRICSKILDISTLTKFRISRHSSFNSRVYISSLEEIRNDMECLSRNHNNWQLVANALNAEIDWNDSQLSDLQKVVWILLILQFKYYTKVTAPADEVYNLMRRQYPSLRDASIVEEELVKKLLDRSFTEFDIDVRIRILQFLAEFMNSFGGNNPMYDNITEHERSLLPLHIQLFSLIRRNLLNPDRLDDPDSIESRMKRSGLMKKLAMENKIFLRILADLKYYEKSSLIQKISDKISILFERTARIIFDWRYLTLELEAQDLCTSSY